MDPADAGRRTHGEWPAFEWGAAQDTIRLGDLAAASGQTRGSVAAGEWAGNAGAPGDALAVVTMTEFVAGAGFDRDLMLRARKLQDPGRTRRPLRRAR